MLSINLAQFFRIIKYLFAVQQLRGFNLCQQHPTILDSWKWATVTSVTWWRKVFRKYLGPYSLFSSGVRQVSQFFYLSGCPLTAFTYIH